MPQAFLADQRSLLLSSLMRFELRLRPAATVDVSLALDSDLMTVHELNE